MRLPGRAGRFGATVMPQPAITARAMPHDDATHDSPFAIGWDHAHYGLTPPLERLCINPRLRHGFQAGRAAFGGRTLAASTPVREWLALRLDALAAGCALETVRLTPGYLARLAVPHCPITREPLATTADAGGWRVARVRRDAGYAAGNLARLGVRADAAQARLGQAEALDLLRVGEADANERHAGLTLAQARRLAVLRSFVQPLSHEAAALPLLVLPPPGLLLFNPLQALQCCVTRAWGEPTPNQRLAALREALQGAASQDAFDAFVAAYHAALAETTPAGSAPATRWALEDAWADGRVLGRWKRFARALTAARCEALLLRLEPQGMLQRPDALATEGWALESGGRAGLPRRLASRPPVVSAAAQRPAPSSRPGCATAPALPPAGAVTGRAHQRNLFTH
jgi:hypothetical protein